MNIIMLGPPGSGKGTQARNLSQLLSISLIDVGKLLREDALSDDMKRIIDSGGLLPDDMVNHFVEGKLLAIISNFILDGFPRTIGQAHFLENLLQSNGMKTENIVRLVVSDDILIQRLAKRRSCSFCDTIYNDDNITTCLKCGDELKGRNDDSLEIVKLRLDKYYEKSRDIVEFYGDKILNVDGDDTVQNITEKIMFKIGFDT